MENRTRQWKPGIAASPTWLRCGREARQSLLMRSLMSRSVSRLVSIASVGRSCSTSVAMESRRLSRSSTSWRPLAVRNSRLARRSLRIVPPLEQAVLDQAIEQPHQRDRLQFEHVGQIDLRQALPARRKPEQHDPLRARRTAALGAMIDVVAQQPRAFDKLRNQLAFQIERHDGLVRFPKAFQMFRILQVIVCLHIKCTHIISVCAGNCFEDPTISYF